MRTGICILTLISGLALGGCGYRFRSSHNLWEKNGIRKLYISNIENNTLRSGVDGPFSSSILKEFARQGRIQIVRQKEQADGILSGTLYVVDAKCGPTTTADQVSTTIPSGMPRPPSDFIVAQEYVVSAELGLELSEAKSQKTLWSKTFSRTKIYPASNQAGDIGNTSVQINESRFQEALADVATNIAVDAHDILFEAF